MTTRYRKDIDGLRAIAVLSVMLYHADLNLFSGGYVGVDIFFVISGYLITGIIFTDLQKNTFRFRAFWVRRVRRILPASIFMLLVVTSVFAIIYPPSIFYDVAQSVIAQLLFASNFLFTLESSYFNQLAEIKPLLHTWSLAIEEQFYFIFPFMLFIIHKYCHRYIVHILIAVCLYSLTISIWPETLYPLQQIFPRERASFFLLPGRAWELGFGAILAVMSIQQPVKINCIFATFIGTVGLFMISIAIFFFNDKTPFPSYYALLPVIGTTFLIAANTCQESPISRLLSTKILTATGLISYSLYLWHWPVYIVFDYFLTPHGLWTKGVAIVSSFFMATISYLYIENPIRRNHLLFTNKNTLPLLGSMCLFLFIAASISLNINGIAFQASFAQDAETSTQFRLCFDEHNHQARANFCEFNADSDSKYSFMVIGDSYAHSLAPAIELAALKANKKGYFSSVGNCLPLSGFITHKRKSLCTSMYNEAFNLIKMHDIRNLILISKWNTYLNWPISNKQPTFSEMWDQSIIQLKNEYVNIFVVEQPPTPGYEPRARYYKNLSDISFTEHHQNNALQREFFSKDKDVELVSLNNALCPNKITCPTLQEQKILYSDFDHLSLLGALKTTSTFLSLLTRMQPNESIHFN